MGIKRFVLILASLVVISAVTVVMFRKQSGPELIHESTSPKPTTLPQPLTAREEHAQQLRYGARTTIEHRLLSAGYDVRVGWLADEGDRDKSLQVMIIGSQVNRPFVYTLLGPGFRQSVKREGFTKILFCRESIGDWIAEYNPQTGNITWY